MSSRLMRELAAIVARGQSGGTRFSIIPTGIGEGGQVKYDFHCLDCGGYVLSAEEPVNRMSKASCKACGQQLGTVWEIEKELRRQLSQAEIDAMPGVEIRDAQ